MLFLIYNILVTIDNTEEGELSFFEEGLSKIEKHLLIRSHRLPLIKNVLEKIDIGILVEAIESIMPDILPYNTKYIFCKKYDTINKDDGNINKNYDGTAIFYRTDMYDLIAHKCVQIKENETQCLLITVFLDKLTKIQFCVIGLHLKAGNTEKEESKRVDQVTYVLEHLSEFFTEKQINSDIPIIIAGDFNSDALSTVYNSDALNIFIQKGFKN